MIRSMLRRYHLKHACIYAVKMVNLDQDTTLFKIYKRLWHWHLDRWGKLAPIELLVEAYVDIARYIHETETED